MMIKKKATIIYEEQAWTNKPKTNTLRDKQILG